MASIGGSALTTVINNISRKNEEANAKAQETMSAQTVEPAQDDSQDTATENSSYSLEKSALPKSLSSNDTGKSLTPKEVYAMNVNATVGIATQITTNVWGQVASASASGRAVPATVVRLCISPPRPSAMASVAAPMAA